MCMKKNLLYKSIAVLLCILMLSIIPLSAYAASDSSKTPVILVTDIIANEIVADVSNSQSEILYPKENNDINKLIRRFIGSYFMASEGRHDMAVDNFMSELNAAMRPLALNPDGSLAFELSTVRSYSYRLDKPTTPASMYFYRNKAEVLDKVYGGIGRKIADRIGDENVFAFNYDWRLDPAENAEKLNQYIQDVKFLKGVNKVTLVAEGFGGIVSSVYLHNYAEANNFADIKNYVLVNSYFQGLGLVGDVFTGNIMVHDSALVRYVNDQPENYIAQFTMWLTQYILNTEWELSHFTATITSTLRQRKAKVYSYVKDIFKTVPGLWAMVPAAQFEDAKQFMQFDPTINAQLSPMNPELLQKIDAYHEVQVAAPETLKKLQQSGAGVAIVAGYNLQNFPITKNSAINQSDGMVDTVYASAGADCLKLNAAYLNIFDFLGKRNAQIVDTRYDNVSGDRLIDASTCALPQNTWFIKNLKHNGFRYDSNSSDFIAWLATVESPNVWRSVKYPQFMSYNKFTQKLNTPSSNSRPEGYLLGDVNLDGKVTAADARIVLRVAAKLEKENKLSALAKQNADVNLDGKIDIKDARLMLRLAANLDLDQ